MIARKISAKLSCFLLRAWTLTGGTLLSFGFATAAIAQSITSVPDGTGTVINQQDNNYLIMGGTQSGSNLFHSFDQFGLNSGAIANFVGNPDLANILGRITGGDVSIINGLLQVSNSNANLYLLNPAGFIFGSGAQLDLTGSFTATTATRIGFGEDQFFNSFGANDYSNLSSAPTSFVFDSATGMILNEGNLAVQPDQSLWLVGSSVLNLGSIQGGDVAIAALPEQRQIKISQEGSLLSLALDAAPLGANPVPDDLKLFTPEDLPQYLTGGYEDKIAINDTGEISLKQGDNLVPFNRGDVGIGGTVQAQNLQLMAAGRVTPTNPALVQADDLTVVRFRENMEDALGYTFIDQRVDNPNELLYGGESGTIATIVLKQEAGLEAVTQALLEFAATGQKLDAINIVAEGNQGYFWLGKDLVRESSLETYQEQLQQWRSVLGEGADLLIYSCFTALGMDGEAFIKQLSDLTGADVAASLDATGSKNFGGNWNLEYSTGEIQADNPFTLETLAVWEGKLATILVVADSGAGSLRDVIENTAASGEIITFDPKLTGTITLGSTINWFTNNLTLDGDNRITVSGGGAYQVFNISAANATIENITIRDGFINGDGYGDGDGFINGDGYGDGDGFINGDGGGGGGGDGGGIQFTGGGTLTISNSTITNNQAVGGYNFGGDGGGISNATGTLRLINSTVSGNQASSNGGGIANYNGTVELLNTTVSDNFVNVGFYGGSGGGIANESGTVTLTDSRVQNNTVNGDGFCGGGGICSSSGSLTLNNSVVSGNSVNSSFVARGGGIAVGNTSVTLINTIVSGNSANVSSAGDSIGGGIASRFDSAVTIQGSSILNNNANLGGGIANQDGTISLTNSTVSGNIATNGGGGIFSEEGGTTVNITDSTVSGNTAAQGGGLYIGSYEVLNLTRSTVSGNTATGDGGGIFFSGFSGSPSYLRNSTISGNTAAGDGGGIFNYDRDVVIENVTIANNSATSGGGIYNAYYGNTTITNSIIANNAGGDVVDNGLSPSGILFEGNNIVRDGSATGAGILNVDPRLKPLDNYGGPTQTHFLLMDSPAIDGGDDGAISSFLGSTDQRGGSRQVDAIDLGAVEFQGTNLSVLSGDGQTTPINTTFDPIVIAAKEKTFENPLEALTVNFKAPNTGASTTELDFSGVTDANGLVSISPTANGLVGSYPLQVSASKAEAIAVNLTNTNVSVLDGCPPDCDPRNPPPNTEVDEQLELEVEDIKETLKKILEETQIKPALIYAIFKPTASSSMGAANPVASPVASAGNKDLEKDENFLKQDTTENPAVGESQWEFSGDRLTDALNATTDHFLNPRETLSGDDQLELIMITVSGKVIRRPVPGATRARVMPYVENFVRGVTNPRFGQTYLAPAQALYDVLVRPLEKELGEEDIDNLTFIMDDGLRVLPVAALHDGQNFIIENYSVGLMPSFSLTNTSGYVEPNQNLLLAMGASEFTNQEDLPAAPLEVKIIEQIWQGDSFVDQQFTVENLISARQEKPYGILHLATHGEFQAGDRSNSFISFADQNVGLDELDKLQLGNPPLELLVLSACRTAIGDRSAELGFSGLALASGAKSAMGSIWYVDDAGTMGLMTRFYSELQDAPIKAEALRQAQLALLRGDVRQEGNQLTSRGGGAPIQLPPEIAEILNLDLTHPFFWSGFALVGNPW